MLYNDHVTICKDNGKFVKLLVKQYDNKRLISLQEYSQLNDTLMNTTYNAFSMLRKQHILSKGVHYYLLRGIVGRNELLNANPNSYALKKYFENAPHNWRRYLLTEQGYKILNKHMAKKNSIAFLDQLSNLYFQAEDRTLVNTELFQTLHNTIDELERRYVELNEQKILDIPIQPSKKDYIFKIKNEYLKKYKEHRTKKKSC